MILNSLNEILISVIIPVYNVEQYVGECLESVLGQLDESIEIIIINDGSTDESYRRCQDKIEEYQNQRIKIVTQSNQGLSVARNNGLQLAEGKYVMFLDSDDMLCEGSFIKLQSYIRQYEDIDVLFFDAVTKDETGAEDEKIHYSREDRVDSVVVTGQEYFCTYYLNPLIVSACLCLYRSEFIRQNKLAFMPGKLHEDIAFSFKTVLSAQKVLYIPDKLYVRRYRSDSITMQHITIKHVQSQSDAYEECLCWIKGVTWSYQCISNALAEFFRIGLRYVFQSVSQCVESKSVLNTLYRDVIDFFSMTAKENRGITYHKVLHESFRCAIQCPYMDTDVILAAWKQLIGEDSEQSIERALEKQLDLSYRKLFATLPLNISGRRVGIYGRGKHTRNLLEKYQQLQGDIVADIMFIDSAEESFGSMYMGRDVVNIKDVKTKLDTIIISSYLYHNKMYRLCETYANEIEIIDIYLQEKTVLF